MTLVVFGDLTGAFGVGGLRWVVFASCECTDEEEMDGEGVDV